MPRTLTAFYDAEILKKDTQPGWLIEIPLAPTVRFCTTGQGTWNSKVWKAEGAMVNWAAGGLPTIILPNYDTSGTALLQANDLLDTPVVVYSWYPSKAREFFRGYLNLSSADYRWSYFDTSFSRMSGSKAPGRRVVGPLFTRRLVPGTELTWFNSTLQVTS